MRAHFNYLVLSDHSIHQEAGSPGDTAQNLVDDILEKTTERSKKLAILDSVSIEDDTTCAVPTLDSHPELFLQGYEAINTRFVSATNGHSLALSNDQGESISSGKEAVDQLVTVSQLRQDLGLTYSVASGEHFDNNSRVYPAQLLSGRFEKGNGMKMTSVEPCVPKASYPQNNASDIRERTMFPVPADIERLVYMETFCDTEYGSEGASHVEKVKSDSRQKHISTLQHIDQTKPYKQHSFYRKRAGLPIASTGPLVDHFVTLRESEFVSLEDEEAGCLTYFDQTYPYETPSDCASASNEHTATFATEQSRSQTSRYAHLETSLNESDSCGSLETAECLPCLIKSDDHQLVSAQLSAQQVESFFAHHDILCSKTDSMDIGDTSDVKVPLNAPEYNDKLQADVMEKSFVTSSISENQCILIDVYERMGSKNDAQQQACDSVRLSHTDAVVGLASDLSSTIITHAVAFANLMHKLKYKKFVSEDEVIAAQHILPSESGRFTSSSLSDTGFMRAELEKKAIELFSYSSSVHGSLGHNLSRSSSTNDDYYLGQGIEADERTVNVALRNIHFIAYADVEQFLTVDDWDTIFRTFVCGLQQSGQEYKPVSVSASRELITRIITGSIAHDDISVLPEKLDKRYEFITSLIGSANKIISQRKLGVATLSEANLEPYYMLNLENKDILHGTIAEEQTSKDNDIADNTSHREPVVPEELYLNNEISHRQTVPFGSPSSVIGRVVSKVKENVAVAAVAVSSFASNDTDAENELQPLFTAGSHGPKTYESTHLTQPTDLFSVALYHNDPTCQQLQSLTSESEDDQDGCKNRNVVYSSSGGETYYTADNGRNSCPTTSPNTTDYETAAGGGTTSGGEAYESATSTTEHSDDYGTPVSSESIGSRLSAISRDGDELSDTETYTGGSTIAIAEEENVADLTETELEPGRTRRSLVQREEAETSDLTVRTTDITNYRAETKSSAIAFQHQSEQLPMRPVLEESPVQSSRNLFSSAGAESDPRNNDAEVELHEEHPPGSDDADDSGTLLERIQEASEPPSSLSSVAVSLSPDDRFSSVQQLPCEPHSQRNLTCQDVFPAVDQSHEFSKARLTTSYNENDLLNTETTESICNPYCTEAELYRLSSGESSSVSCMIRPEDPTESFDQRQAVRGIEDILPASFSTVPDDELVKKEVDYCESTLLLPHDLSASHTAGLEEDTAPEVTELETVMEEPELEQIHTDDVKHASVDFRFCTERKAVGETWSDNASESSASLKEFERLERELIRNNKSYQGSAAHRPSRSLSGSDLELESSNTALKNGKPPILIRRQSANGSSVSSLLEFERLERELCVSGGGSGEFDPNGFAGKASISPGKSESPSSLQGGLASPLTVTCQSAPPFAPSMKHVSDATSNIACFNTGAAQDPMVLSDIREESDTEDFAIQPSVSAEQLENQAVGSTEYDFLADPLRRRRDFANVCQDSLELYELEQKACDTSESDLYLSAGADYYEVLNRPVTPTPPVAGAGAESFPSHAAHNVRAVESHDKDSLTAQAGNSASCFDDTSEQPTKPSLPEETDDIHTTVSGECSDRSQDTRSRCIESIPLTPNTAAEKHNKSTMHTTWQYPDSSKSDCDSLLASSCTSVCNAATSVTGSCYVSTSTVRDENESDSTMQSDERSAAIREQLFISGDTESTFQEYAFQSDTGIEHTELDLDISARNVGSAIAAEITLDRDSALGIIPSVIISDQRTSEEPLGAGSSSQRLNIGENTAPDHAQRQQTVPLETTVTTFETSREGNNGSIETISRTVNTRMTHPLEQHVRFTGSDTHAKVADYIRRLHNNNDIGAETGELAETSATHFESADDEGNVTRTTVTRRFLPGSSGEMVSPCEGNANTVSDEDIAVDD